MPEFRQQPDAKGGDRQKPKTVLIVDNEAIIRDLCKRALDGYLHLEACDGEEALATFAKGGVDVVLTDVRMPRMGGIELLKRLKEIEPTIVVIVMTGFAEKDIILDALKADADDFITKPLNLLQLRTVIDKSLVRKALKEEVANLKSIDSFKTNFLSIVSHKFRTPITSISLFLQNIAGGVFDPDDPTFRQNVNLVYEESRYLERLVADLLTFSRVMDASERLKPEPCELDRIIPMIFTESQEVAGKPDMKVSFDLEELPPLMLDREKITFAIRQVIDNAYKFSRSDGTVALSLKKTNGTYMIVIEDNGIGIARENLPKVFEKFYQVDSALTGQVKGFGLGLYYAQEFVRLHGGSIIIDSQPGSGTKVTITLPAQDS